MGGILWPYQTQGLFIICVPDTDVTENSHSDCSLTVGHKKYPSFNLVKVHYPFYALFLDWVPELASGVPVLTLFPLKLVLF